MTGLIIADDELIIRQGLQSIPWCDYGIELKGLAANGREALSLIESTMPGILLTDIRMPGMDGLKLIDAAKQIIPDIKTILLTGYQDFNYAYTAIKLGAASYILKPSDPDEIIQAVVKAKNQIDAEMNERREKEKIRQQIGSMQDIVRNTLLVDSLNGKSSAAAENNASPECPDIVRPEMMQVHNGIVIKLLDFMEKHYMEDISLNTVSEHVYMNPVYLSRLIKKETGENFLEILTRIRLRKACEMLGDCNFKAYEVAEKVGIKDSRYFSQVFRKYFGMTPSEYKEKIVQPKRIQI